MSILIRKPILAGLLVFVILIALCLAVPVPVMNGICSYDQGLVHFGAPAKISLQNLVGWNLRDLAANGILPSTIKLTGQGWLMLILFHIGMPTLLYLRFFFAKRRAELPDEE